MMDLDEIRQILELMREHDVSELEIERDTVKLRLRKGAGGSVIATLPPSAFEPPAANSAAPSGAARDPGVPVLTAIDEDVDLAIVKSPIVGTFYRAAEPGAKDFVDVGQTVRKGDVLCIIEAMKLMNEINADCDGAIVKIFAENGQAVQYGERLFAIRPA